MLQCLSNRGADRWLDEQMFEEDVRAVLRMMRPNRRERLLGWSEYRTGGADFRVTISWAKEFERPGDELRWQIPRLADVLEAVLIGSARNGDALLPEEEFALYRSVVEELERRVEELKECYT